MPEFGNIVPLFRIGYFHRLFSRTILRFPVHGVLGSWAIQATFRRFHPLKYILLDGIFTIVRCCISRMSVDTISSSCFSLGRRRSERFVLDVKISLGTIRLFRIEFLQTNSLVDGNNFGNIEYRWIGG